MESELVSLLKESIFYTSSEGPRIMLTFRFNALGVVETWVTQSFSDKDPVSHCQRSRFSIRAIGLKAYAHPGKREATWQALCDWSESYAAGTHLPLPAPLIEPERTQFSEEVITYIKGIPFGQSLSYGELAEQIGHPQASRAVGTACGRNRFPLVIPCHRIVSAGERLGGYTARDKKGSLMIKDELLSFEGVSVVRPHRGKGSAPFETGIGIEIA
jgi:O-6-methylguanine DNA methyltransferase